MHSPRPFDIALVESRVKLHHPCFLSPRTLQQPSPPWQRVFPETSLQKMQPAKAWCSSTG